MIVSPTAVEELGAEFPKNPVGAGPFMFDHWNPGEEIVLKRNPDYWGEKAHLDSVRFVVLAPQTALDTLLQGGLQTAYFLDPTMSAQAKAKGLGGVTTIAGAGEGLVINAAEGAPGHDVKVRQAIGFAVDTQQVYDRVYGDAGVPGNFVVAPGSIFSSGTPSKTADPEKAKALVAEAKQAGWDGTLRFTCDNSASRTTTALTVQAQLKAAGIDAQLNTVDGIGSLIGAVAKGDFDIACYGMSVDDALPYDAIARNLEGSSAENRGKYANPEMDAAIAKLKVAATNEVAKAIIADIQTVFDEDPPFVVFNNTPQVTTWNTNVHGIIATIKSQVLIGGAWLSE
jgi:peptide/nickel transport system substrate-binding protein